MVKEKNSSPSCVIEHAEISEQDIVEYEEDIFSVLRVWNHGWQQWWFDLKAINPIFPGTTIYREQFSVASIEVKLVKKAKKE